MRPNNADGPGQWLVEVECDADDVFQRWYLEPTGEPDTYRFVSAASGYPYHRITLDERGCLTRNVPEERPQHLGTNLCRSNSTAQSRMLLSEITF